MTEGDEAGDVGVLTRDRSGLGASIRRGSRMRNGPVSGEYLCHLRECVVDIKSFSVGQDALVDGREAELVGVLLPPVAAGRPVSFQLRRSGDRTAARPVGAGHRLRRFRLKPPSSIDAGRNAVYLQFQLFLRAFILVFFLLFFNVSHRLSCTDRLVRLCAQHVCCYMN